MTEYDPYGDPLPPLAEREAAAAAENRALNEGVRDGSPDGSGGSGGSNSPPKPEQQPVTIPDVKIPDEAVVTERNALGVPITKSYNGEDYFLPGSLSYAMGHRTESGRIESLQYGANFGPHDMNTPDPNLPADITEPSIVLINNNGKAVGRITQTQIDKSHSGDSGGNNWDTYLQSGQYRVPVTNSDGKEVLLTPKQADSLSGAQSDVERLSVAKALNLVPQDTTLKDFTDSPVVMSNVTDNKIVNGRVVQVGQTAQGAFEDAQFKKNNTKLADGNYISNVDLKSLQDDLAKTPADDPNHDVKAKYLNTLTGKDGGFDAAKRVIDDYNAEITVKNADIALANQRSETQKAAFAQLQPYTSQAWGAGPPMPGKVETVNGVRKLVGGESPTVDVLGFIHDNPKTAEQTLVEAKYNPDDVKTWVSQAQTPMYLNGLFDAKVQQVRNDLLKTAKFQPGETLEDDSFINRISGEAGAQVATQFTKPEMDAILKEKGIQGANADAQMVLLGAGVGGALPWKAAALASGLASGGVTAAHWGYLSTPEKVVAVGEDVAITLAMMYGDKILGGIAKLPIAKAGGESLADVATRTPTRILSAVADTERLAAKAGQEGSILKDAMTEYAQSTAKLAEKVKSISMSAEESGKAAKTVPPMPTKTVFSGVATQGENALPIFQQDAKAVLETAKKQTAIKEAEAASRAADNAFLAKLQTTKSLSPGQLAELEKKSGIIGLKSAIQNVSSAVDDVNTAWKYVDRSPFKANAQTAAELEANNRHILRLAELNNAQSKLADALQKADSSLAPRYAKFKVEIKPWQNELLVKLAPALSKQESLLKEEYTGALSSRKKEIEYQLENIQKLKTLERVNVENPIMGTISGRQAKMGMGYVGNFGQNYGGSTRIAKSDTNRLFEQLKFMRDSKVVTETEYQQFLKEQKDNIKREMDALSGERNILGKDVKLRPPDAPLTPKQRAYIQKLADESRAKYESGLQSQTKEAQTAVAEREMHEMQAVPLPKAEPKEELKASDLPKVQAQGKLVPFKLPIPQKQSESVPSRQSTQQEAIDAARMASGRREFTSPLEDVRSQTITDALQKTGEFTKLNPNEWTQVREQIQSGIQAQQKAIASGATQAQAKAAVQSAVQQKALEQVKQQTQPATQTKAETKTQTQTRTKEIVDRIIKTPKPEPPKPPKTPIPFPSLHGGGTDKEKRKLIKNAGGAVAWRMGQVNGKDRWDVITNPYKSNEDYLMVLGKRPEGAAVVAYGHGSVRRTAQMLYGQPPKYKFSVDSGFEDIIVTPQNKGIQVVFKPDPHGLTKGNITIGQKHISISRRQGRIGSGRSRISQSRPRIGR